MKKTVLALVTVALLAPALALTPIELIGGVGEDLLEVMPNPFHELQRGSVRVGLADLLDDSLVILQQLHSQPTCRIAIGQFTVA